MPLERTLSLERVAHGRDNNFDVLRLCAALLVLVSHAFPLTDRSEPLARIGGPTLGGLGVALFFGMSGFLIAASWLRAPKPASFMRKRAARILPGLWVAVAATTLVLGTAVTMLPIGDYLTAPGTWGYLVRASLLAPFDGSLPGVFGDNPYPDAINGSLWTLPLEVLAYGMVLVLGVTGLLGRARVLGGLWLVALVVLLAVHGSGLADPASLFAYFLTGSLLYVARSRVRLSWLVAALGVAAWVMTFDTPLLLPVGAITLPYAALVVAYRTTSSLRGVSRLGDVSYGMYVYAFPVQQALVHAWPGMHPATNVLVAAPLTWVAGLASWRLVEQPALRRFGSRRQATPSAVDAVDPAVDAAEVEPAHLG